MKQHLKHISLILLFLFTLFSCEHEEDVPFYRTESHPIPSNYTGHKYIIDVLYPTKFDSTKKYHTYYVLDGDYDFEYVGQEIQNDYPENSILIGIRNEGATKREIDYSYPSDDFVKESGGAKEFVQFINHELIPYVQDTLHIQASESTIIGGSLGGYFAIYITFQQESLSPFNNVIAVSPSLWWSNSYIFFLENEYYASGQSLNKKMYIAMGDIEGVTMNANFDAFIEKIESRKYEGLVLYHERLHGTTHNRSTGIAYPKGLHIINQ